MICVFITPLFFGQKIPTEPFPEIPIPTQIQVEDSVAKDLPRGTPEPPPPTICFKKEEGLFNPIILEAANKHQVNPALIKAIIMAESGFKPRAVSKRGAKGLMQLMPRTAEALGVQDSFNPAHNINGGVKYFKRLLTLFDGDVKLALAAYNAGSRKVKEYKGIPPFKVTRHYIEKVFEYYLHYKKHMAG
jgi:soluble lytic murein transglycosylase-like protein